MAKALSQKTVLALAGITAVVAIGLILTLRDTAPDIGSSSGDPERYASAQNFTYLPPKNWNRYNAAMKDVQSLTPNQQITVGIVNDPTQEEMAYFATTAGNPEAGEDAVLSIYRYNTSDFTFERIYRQTLSAEDFPTTSGYDYKGWHVVGYDSGKLAVLSQDPLYTPEACDDLLTRGRHKDDQEAQMLSLDLSDPFAKGLTTYKVPENVYQDALERQADCAGRL